MNATQCRKAPSLLNYHDYLLKVQRVLALFPARPGEGGATAGKKTSWIREVVCVWGEKASMLGSVLSISNITKLLQMCVHKSYRETQSELLMVV